MAERLSPPEIPEAVTMIKRIVDEDIPAVPVGSPSPAAPSPAAPATKIETEIDAGIPPQTHINVRVWERRVIAPDGWSPRIGRIVIRHVPFIRVCRLDADRSLPALVLRGDGLLRCRMERPSRLSCSPHVLHRLHHVRLLGKKGVAKLRSPPDILAQPGEHIRESDQPLDAGIPILFFGLVHELRGFPVRMVPYPLFGLGDLDRVSGSGQHLTHHGIGV